MQFNAKVELSKFKSKLRKWMKEIREDELDSLRDYARDFTRYAIRFTPPGNGKRSGQSSLRMLRERIRRDFEGDTDKEHALSDDDIRWSTDHYGQHYARLPNGKYASPFRAVVGRITDKKLRALNLGKYHVAFTGENLYRFMRPYIDQDYWWSKRNKSSAVHLIWRGERHLAPKRAIKAEIRRRQALVGRLLSGWKPVARKARVVLPAVAERHNAPGSVTIQRSAMHGAVLTAKNGGNFPELQAIINRHVPKLNKTLRKTAAQRTRALAGKLKKAA